MIRRIGGCLARCLARLASKGRISDRHPIIHRKSQPQIPSTNVEISWPVVDDLVNGVCLGLLALLILALLALVLWVLE
jgi:hypothetical protein